MYNNKKIAIIGASYLQEPLVRKAKELGLYTHCFAWRDGAVCADIADEFHDISIIEKDAILDICQKAQIDGVCTIASDVAAPTVSYIAEKMGLTSNPYEAAVRANNKYLMRNAFMKAGVPCPLYRMVTSIEEINSIDWAYPLIVKPSDRSGSLGVTKVLSPEELAPAVEKAISVSFKKQAMVEEFIEGREISVEFISYKGTHFPLQITDKVTTEAPHFVELEHHQPSTLSDDMFAKIYDITKTALNALGLTNGASHAEYRITPEGRIVVMEIGGRMGGDFIGSDLVRLSTGYDFVKGVIDVALGGFEEPKKTINKHSGVYFLCKETKHLLPAIKGWQRNPVFISGEITDYNLRSVEKSADRSGYLIYQSSERVILKAKLAIMGAGKWQMPICLKAKEMGIETHAFAFEEGAVAKEVVDYFYPISLADKEKIVEKCKEIGVNGVITCASDFATEVSCWVAEQLGLNSNSYDTVINIHNKAWVREKTKQLTSICQPCTSTGDLSSIKIPIFPCIVKPIYGNGKRGVWLVNNQEEFETLKKTIEYNRDEDALAEQFIIGKEYSVESLSFHGQHYVVQITEKVSDGAPHFVELGHHQPADISEILREQMTKAVIDILSAVGYSNGASHIELKITDEGKIYLIDLNPRGGGDYISTHLIHLSTNCDFSKEIINIALDRYNPSVYPYKNIAYSGVYFLTKQTARLLPYFDQDIPCVIQKEYQKTLTESITNNDRNGYLIYQDSKKLIL